MSGAAYAIDDLSAYVIAGRVKVQPSPVSETAARTPAQGVDDGVVAERIGFRRVFLSERWNLKEAGALLGRIAARTTRIGVGAGVIPPAPRHPMHAAGFASTMQSELIEPAKLVPPEWMRDSAAYGSISQCLELFQRFCDAGADELVTLRKHPRTERRSGPRLGRSGTTPWVRPTVRRFSWPGPVRRSPSARPAARQGIATPSSRRSRTAESSTR